MTDAEIRDQLSQGSRIYANTVDERDDVFDRLDDLGYDTGKIRDFWLENPGRQHTFYIGLYERIGHKGLIMTWSSNDPYAVTLYPEDIGASETQRAKLSDAEFKSALDAFLS